MACFRTLLFSLLISVIGFSAEAREHIRMAGSSTVFPFAAAAAEEFGRNTEFKTPIVESTGTGGGFKLFCGGVGAQHPDFSNASRRIKESEQKDCALHGVKQILEIPLGFDGIVIANKKGATRYSFTKEQLFLALARRVPKNGSLVDNPYTSWRQIDPALPDVPIEVYGPPPTSGTRDAFVELLMDKACEHFPEYEKAFSDTKTREVACRTLREDGRFIEAGENENLLIQKLEHNAEALAIFGYSFLEQNHALIQASTIGGVEPAFENIANGTYGISRSLYIYAKMDHVRFVPGIKPFITEMTSEEALHPEGGYLVLKGLIPLPKEQRDAVRAKVNAL